MTHSAKSKQQTYFKLKFNVYFMKIGIIGGGQLGLMIAEQAKIIGAETVALDPSSDAPAFKVTDDHIIAAYDDANALEILCQQCDVVTYEFENIPSAVLVPLCEKYNIKQGYKQLLDSQDRLHEKNNAREHGLQTPDFRAVDSIESLHQAVEELGYPAVLKTRTLGYDGHGQAVLRSADDMPKALDLITVPCILEKFVDFDFETSAVVVSSGEQTVVFPMGLNIHRDGILDLCIVPLAISDELRARIEEQSKKFMEECGYRGILTIEYFVKGEEVIFNEMAPRPHNSGHYTIEGTTTNQFRELVHYLLDMPLEEPKLVAPTIMKNILGEDLVAAKEIAQNPQEGCYVHIYGKSETKLKRKMGHITFVGMDRETYDKEWKEKFVTNKNTI